LAAFNLFRYLNDKAWKELYDLKNDPNEEFNPAKKPQYQVVLAQLRRSLENFIEKYRDP
jgi:hypothetical protein